MTKYRVAVKCLNCGSEYFSRKLPEKRLPKKCKECKSVKLAENPDKKTVYYKVKE